MFDLLPGPPLNFCTSPPLEALKPHRSHSTTHILMHNHGVAGEGAATAAVDVNLDDDAENMGLTKRANGDKNQSTNRRLSGPINSSARHLYVSSNCPGFKPAARTRRSFRTEPMTTNLGTHNERCTAALGEDQEGATSSKGGVLMCGDDGDSEVERFNFEGIQISYSSPSLPSSSSALDMDSISPPAAKLFHCEAPVSPKRRPLKHHNHQRMQRLQRPCLDFDKMQQVSDRSVALGMDGLILMVYMWFSP